MTPIGQRSYYGFMERSLLNEEVVSKIPSAYSFSRFNKDSPIISKCKLQLSLNTTVIAQQIHINW
jgi:hypothetical protein